MMKMVGTNAGIDGENNGKDIEGVNGDRGNGTGTSDCNF